MVDQSKPYQEADNPTKSMTMVSRLCWHGYSDMKAGLPEQALKSGLCGMLDSLKVVVFLLAFY